MEKLLVSHVFLVNLLSSLVALGGSDAEHDLSLIRKLGKLPQLCLIHVVQGDNLSLEIEEDS